MLEQTLGEQILEEMQNINNRIDEVEQKQYSMIQQADSIDGRLDNIEQRMHNLEELLHALINQLQAKNANQAAIVINTSTTRIGG